MGVPEGAVVGVKLGGYVCVVGTAVGTSVGCSEGVSEGTNVGCSEGI